MVKNSGGGNKAKKFASKSFIISNRATRFALDKAEVYAIVTKLMGGNICEVLCIDGSHRLCVIRGKFSGKGKRDNILCRGKWILVGLRDWEITTKENGKEKCDLLEVYNDADKEKLIKNTKENFRVFLPVVSIDNEIDDSQVQFINDREDELFNKEKEIEEREDVEEGFWGEREDVEEDLRVTVAALSPTKEVSSIIKNMDLINVDDI
jgi:initiation factor 1A